MCVCSPVWSDSLAIGRITFSNVASLLETDPTTSSMTFFDFAKIFFVSSSTDCGVAVKEGGACGGRLKLTGAMVEVVSGRVVDQVMAVCEGRI